MACFFRDAVDAPGLPAPEDSLAGLKLLKILGRPELPFEFAGHRVLRELASGGMGTVYEAEQLQLKRTVALKLVRSSAFARPEELQRFRAEAETVARLDHPNIVPVYEVGESGGQPYFTMKLLPGGTLADRLKAGPMPPREAAQMMAKLARAVHHAHERGVLHRDLKPGNVLLDATGEPCLTDFGLAKISDIESGLTLSTAHLGTPQYMSPEQATGKIKELSTLSDVWSLGAVFYQMLCGRVPFSGQNHAEIFRKILEEEPVSLGRGGKGLNGPEEVAKVPSVSLVSSVPFIAIDLSTLAMRCLEKDPARRPPSAAFLADELERWLSGEPILSRPITAWEKMHRWVKRYPGRVALIMALALSILGGTATSLVLWQRAEAHATEASLARDAAAENAYFAIMANALHERTRFDFASARHLLSGLPAERRGFEWRLVHWLCQGDETWSTTVPGAEPRQLARDPANGGICLLSADRLIHALDAKTGQMHVIGKVPMVPSGTVPAQAPARLNGFQDFAFAPDGAHYFVIDGGVLLVVERQSEKVVFAKYQTACLAAWLSDSRLIFSSSSAYRVAEGEVTAWIHDLHDASTTDMPPVGIAGPFAVSPDRSRVAWIQSVKEATYGRRIVVRRMDQITSLEPETAFPQNGVGSVYSLEFSPQGDQMAASWSDKFDGKAGLFSVSTGEVLAEQPVLAQSQVVCGGSEPLLASFGQDPWITVLNTSIPRNEVFVYDDANQGPGIFIDAERPLRPPERLLTRSAQDARIRLLFGHEAPPRSVLLLPEEHAILSAGADGTVRRWPELARVPHANRLNNISTEHIWHHPIASPDGRRVICVDMKGRGFLGDFTTRQRVAFDYDHDGIACFDDGRYLLREATPHLISCWQSPAKAGEQPVKLWSTPCGRSVQGFRQIIHSATSADNRHVAVLMPGKLIVVDMETHAVQETGDEVMDYGLTPGQTVAISPDGGTVAVTGFLGFRARFYDFGNLARGHQKCIPAKESTIHDTACFFSRDGQRLYVGNEAGWVRVYDVKTQRELPAESWRAHTTAITALSAAHDGKVIATAADGSLALWSTAIKANEPRRERLRITMDRASNWLHFATEDRALLHCAPERPVEIWEAAAGDK